MLTQTNLMNDKKKVLLGLSGGVDSTAAALILKNQGYEVIGMFFDVLGDKTSERNEAKDVADQLGIDFIYRDVSKKFESIINYFCESYHKGETPNPCVICNPTVKFATMIEEADRVGAYYIATGHYAKVYYDAKLSHYYIKRANYLAKDQSYMLYRLESKILSRMILPLGDVESKEEIRKLVRSYSLKNADTKDSQEICFIKEKSYVDFLKSRSQKKEKKVAKENKEISFYANYNFNSNLAEEVLTALNSENPDLALMECKQNRARYSRGFMPGDFVDKTGNFLGKHNGIVNYTIGQRKGLGITVGKPIFVTKVDHNENMVTLGDEVDLFSAKIQSKNNVFNENIVGNDLKVTAKIRYSAEPAEAILKILRDGKVETSFKETQRAATPGQSIVFYKDDLVIGGGIII